MTPFGTSLVQRLLVAVIFIPILLWLFIYRGVPLFVFLIVLSAFGQRELYHMLSLKLRFLHHVIGFSAGAAIIADAYFVQSTYLAGILAWMLMFSFLVEVFNRHDRKLENMMLSLFAAVYPALFISFLVKIDQFPFMILGSFTSYLLVYTLVVIWIFDSVSYFAGKLCGRRPFFPNISPKKTVEGFIGGCIGVIVFSLVFGLVYDRTVIVHAFLLAVIIGITGQIGDLSESVIKRDVGTKDSSRMLPGHGGILDRFDSLFFAGPAVYGYLLLYAFMSGGIW